MLDVVLEIKSEIESYTGKKIDVNKEIDKIEVELKKKGGKPPKGIFKKFKETQILISNTQSKALDLFVKIVGIEKYFPSSHRFGVDSHSQRQITKLDCLRAFLEDKKFPEGIISIGDSPGDMALIHQYPNTIGYLYTHPGRVHREANCHYKIQDLREVTEMSVVNILFLLNLLPFLVIIDFGINDG